MKVSMLTTWSSPRSKSVCESNATTQPPFQALFSHFFAWANPASFRSFQAQILQKKSVGVGGIRTRIFRVKGKHAYHLTTTTTHIF